jgi:polyhydroxyalkanoate synthesis repressor PhaR
MRHEPKAESQAEGEHMVRLIKRYESRKLYDTEESRYVSLEEIAAFVRSGQEVRVVDNATSEDVTGQTLTQIILEEGKAGRSALPAELMHDLVRAGERALSSSVEQVQSGVDRLLQASIDRVGPLRRAREEMSVLRSRLEVLEDSLRSLEVGAPPTALSKAAPKKATKKVTRKPKTAARKKTAAKATTKTSAGAKKTAARSRARKAS